VGWRSDHAQRLRLVRGRYASIRRSGAGRCSSTLLTTARRSGWLARAPPEWSTGWTNARSCSRLISRAGTSAARWAMSLTAQAARRTGTGRPSGQHHAVRWTYPEDRASHSGSAACSTESRYESQADMQPPLQRGPAPPV